MVVGEPMVVELSVARTTPKWIVALPMPHVGWPNLWSKLDFAAGKQTPKNKPLVTLPRNELLCQLFWGLNR